MLNRVVLMGRLVAEPELKTTGSGISVCSFCIAVDRNYVKQGTERQTDFINVVAWRQTAEFLCKYFGKGQLIALEGSLQSRTYQDRDGNNRSVTEVVADNVFFTGDRRERTSTGSYGNYGVPMPQDPPVQPQRVSQAENTYTSGMPEDFEELPTDDDLPF
ncbi:MAG: single-stranded DNA-binding protein [Acutalibacteraceae bacterium]|nr:single-stranded DNA-binding protein [Acutalibacteraceae bacterium]